MEENVKKIFNTVMTFTKWITIIWLFVWVETILFSEAAVFCNLGDSSAIMAINDDVVQIGLVICGFYFSTKCVENVAKGIENFLLIKGEKIKKKEKEEEESDG